MRALFVALAAAAIVLFGSVARADDATLLRIAFARLEGADVELMRKQAAEFGKTHPNVRIEVVADQDRGSSTHDLWARYLALGDPSIDVYVIDEPWIGEFAFAAWIRPLDELSTWANSALHPAALSSAKWHGRLVAVPLELSCNALFYRSDWLDAPPRTLEELFADAHKLAADHHARYGVVLHPQFLYNDVNPILWASGGGPLSNGSVRLDDPANIAALTAIRAEVVGSAEGGTTQTWTRGALPSAAQLKTWHDWPSEYHTAVEPFGSGDAAFMINWLRYKPAGLPASSYKIAPLPGLAGRGPGTGATLGSWYLAVNASSRNGALAAELLKFLSSENMARERFEQLGAFPPLARPYDDKAWLDKYPELAVAKPIFANAQSRMPVTDERSVDEIVGRAYEQIVLEGAPPQSTLEAASKEANAILTAFPPEVSQFPETNGAGATESDAGTRRIIIVAIAIWVVALAMLGGGSFFARRRGGLFRRLATKVSVLGLTAVLLTLTTSTAVALSMLVKNQEDAIAEAQSIFRTAIRDHATTLVRQIALDASVLREVSTVDKHADAASRRAFKQSLEDLLSQGAYRRDIVVLQLIDSDGKILVDGKTIVTQRRGASDAPQTVDDPLVKTLARFGRRTTMRDVAATADHPPYLEVMAPLIQNGRQAGGVRVGYSKQEQEDRIRDLRTRQETLMRSAVYLVIVAALGLIVLATVLLRLFARSVADPLVRLSDLAAKVGAGDLTVHAAVPGRDEVFSLAVQLNGMVSGLRERQVIKETLGRYVGPSVSDVILAGDVDLGGEEREVTLLFSDVRGFTTMSEAMKPHDVVRVLNSYFERMVDAVFEHDGMLDKFIGDGLMAVFGAPRSDEDHAMHAVKCALEMRRMLVEVNAMLKKSNLPELAIGIGLHTGRVVVGNIGSTKRMEYTAIGDAVNLAARLESQTKEQGVDILISEATYERVSSRVVADPLGSVKVKGKTTGVAIYALRDLR
jgi:class 3 adenylate cyclase/ABC-type glycerol-3-phosphate transport system substrate-binding protein